GAAQILVPKDRYRGLRGSSQHRADDFQPGRLTASGTLKIIGAIVLVLPPLAALPPVRAPLAAGGLMLVMAGAATTSFGRCEWAYMAVAVVFLAAFAFLAWGRFALAPFAG